MRIVIALALAALFAACSQPQGATSTGSPSPSPSPSAAASEAPSASPTAVARTAEPTVPNDPNAALAISGRVLDAASGQPIADACITVGRPVVCWTRTDAEGRFTVGFPAAAPAGMEWELYALKEPDYPPKVSARIKVNGREQMDIRLERR